MSKTYINSYVIFIVVLPIFANIRLMSNENDEEPSIQREQKKFLQKPLYLPLLSVLCILIMTRKFFHVNGYCSIYKYWKAISFALTFGIYNLDNLLS